MTSARPSRRRALGALLGLAACACPVAVRSARAHAAVASATCRVPAMAAPSPNRPRYVVSLDVDRAARVVQGHLQVTFVPDLAIRELVFRVWPDAPDAEAATDDWDGMHEQISSVVVSGQSIAVTRPDPTTVVVRLGRPLRHLENVSASLDFRLRLPTERNDRIASGDDWVRLGSFLPLLAWEPSVGWNRTPPTTARGEASMFPAADFEVTYHVPDGDTVLATGAPDDQGTWHSVGTRDVGATIGRLRVAEADARAGSELPVRVRVGVASSSTDDPARVLARTVALLESEAGRYGMYPWPTFTVGITPELRGGIEYPGHVMLAAGAAENVLAHEIGHQWFYGLVGNDQGRDPWLDEGLASWAEARAMGATDRFANRVAATPAVRARMTRPMSYWDGVPALYSAGAYAAPVDFLARLGSAANVDCALRDYVAREAYAVARPEDLLAVLRSHFPSTYPKLAPTYGLR